MRIESFADHVLTCRASLGPNVNVHGTAFAGSLYAVQLHALDASIVIANGNIDYANPVAEDIVVQCAFGEHKATMEGLKTTGKARFQLARNVLLNDGSSAGGFSGLYAVRLNR